MVHSEDTSSARHSPAASTDEDETPIVDSCLIDDGEEEAPWCSACNSYMHKASCIYAGTGLVPED